jgi:hypothetical protein
MADGLTTYLTPVRQQPALGPVCQATGINSSESDFLEQKWKSLISSYIDRP